MNDLVFNQEQLKEIGAAITRQTGLHFPPDRWRELMRGASLAARDLGFAESDAFVRQLLASPLPPREIAVLARHLAVAETYFYREQGSLDILRDQILPALIAARRGREQRLRLWSAGCCTGEEAYSLAILLREILPDHANWEITILGTDFNADSLKKATAGVYTEWSFRDTPAWVRERYFQCHGKHFEVRHDIKQMVTLDCLNLAEDPYPALSTNTEAMDVILCRNVLMYFSPEDAARVIQKFHHALVEGGWFISSPVEAGMTCAAPFARRTFPHAVLFQKDSSSEPRATEPIYQWASTLITGHEEPVALVEEIIPNEPPVPDLAGLLKDSLPPPSVAPEMSYQTAQALYEQGEYASAARQLEQLLSPPKAASEAASYSTIVHLLARACANQGRLTEALAWCERGLTAEKLATGLHYLSAGILQSQGRTEAAISALRRALYLDPQFILGHYSLGNLHRRQGRFKDANRHFKNALTLLRPLSRDEPLPESEGLTAGRLAEIIQTTIVNLEPANA